MFPVPIGLPGIAHRMLHSLQCLKGPYWVSWHASRMFHRTRIWTHACTSTCRLPWSISLLLSIRNVALAERVKVRRKTLYVPFFQSLIIDQQDAKNDFKNPMFSQAYFILELSQKRKIGSHLTTTGTRCEQPLTMLCQIPRDWSFVSSPGFQQHCTSRTYYCFSSHLLKTERGGFPKDKNVSETCFSHEQKQKHVSYTWI